MTAVHALVVDDHEAIRDEIRDRLDAMGHTCCLAGSSEEAQRLLGQQECVYHYVILDLEIPVRFGRLPMINTGIKLIDDVRAARGSIPIVVITSHAEGNPDLAVEVLRHNRTNDFVRKPFPEPGKGRTLETAITEMLTVCSGSGGASSRVAQVARQFTGGDLVFYPDQVILEGIRVAGETGQTLIRRILDLLRNKDDHGRFIRLTGLKLAQQIGVETTEPGINGAVRDFRKHLTDVLLREADLRCSDVGVIERGSKGQPGYRLCPSIRVRVETTPWQPMTNATKTPIAPVGAVIAAGATPAPSPQMVGITTAQRVDPVKRKKKR
jgi:CheY-like chemotaxis protein